jgi:hypothetical protein
VLNCLSLLALPVSLRINYLNQYLCPGEYRDRKNSWVMSMLETELARMASAKVRPFETILNNQSVSYNNFRAEFIVAGRTKGGSRHG